jgi:hypothetical protein
MKEEAKEEEEEEHKKNIELEERIALSISRGRKK